MKIVDLSLLRKEDFVIKAITGQEYHIDGNFNTDFYLDLYNSYQKVQDVIKGGDIKAATALLKEIAIMILKLDTTKEVTEETLKEQKFDSFEVLQFLLSATMEQANQVTANPNFKSLPSE